MLGEELKKGLGGAATRAVSLVAEVRFHDVFFGRGRRFPYPRECRAHVPPGGVYIEEQAVGLAYSAPTVKTPGMTETELDRDAALPTAFRGYARESVDSLLEEIEKGFRALVAERDELRAKLADATERLAERTTELERHAGQQQAIADALIEAERLRAEGEKQVSAMQADAMRDAADMRARLEQEGHELVAAAKRDVEGIQRDAELKAEAIVREAESFRAQVETEMQERRARAEGEADELLGDARALLEERQHRADDFLNDARTKLGALVRDLMEQIDTATWEPDASVDPEQAGS